MSATFNNFISTEFLFVIGFIFYIIIVIYLVVVLIFGIFRIKKGGEISVKQLFHFMINFEKTIRYAGFYKLCMNRTGI
ncbi:MAG: hypothetical protein A7315_11210 [Candidatus Altiarchaeales archaeon WOR_SM1_79]|nr:MAG: hypothetical protein A7315_11210 [Candidatus Altiarchaeales archaeon WOR_SM1_79]